MACPACAAVLMAADGPNFADLRAAALKNPHRRACLCASCRRVLGADDGGWFTGSATGGSGAGATAAGGAGGDAGTLGGLTAGLSPEQIQTLLRQGLSLVGTGAGGTQPAAPPPAPKKKDNSLYWEVALVVLAIAVVVVLSMKSRGS